MKNINENVGDTLCGLHICHLFLIVKTASICRNTGAQVPLYWTEFSQLIPAINRNQTEEEMFTALNK